MNAATRDALTYRLSQVEEEIGHTQNELKNREGTLLAFKKRLLASEQVAEELKEELEAS